MRSPHSGDALRACFYALVLSLSVAPVSVLRAQSVPQLLNYQGRLTANGVNFNGAGQFKFALVNPGATTTYWTNDGTLVAGVPTNAVTLTVTNGLYSVLLGDTAVTNMTIVPLAVFTNSDVRLRVWFNDGTHGEQLLSPDQRIAAVGYAEMAAGLNLPTTRSTGTEGVVLQNGARLLHTYGTDNFFAGQGAGNFSLTTTAPGDNTGIGSGALVALTTGQNNTAIGYQALPVNDTGTYNTASGWSTLHVNNSGFANTAMGAFALFANTMGGFNTGLGADALIANMTGSNNTAVGLDSLRTNSTGSNNIGIGMNAGRALTTGSNNIDIANDGSTAEANTTRIGSSLQTRTFVSGIRGVTTGVANGVTVLIDSNGQFGTISSSRRYKEEVTDMGDASARILGLRPVTFRYKQPFDHGEKPLQFGLIAEEVAETFPELAVYNEKGEPDAVKYQDLTPLLLNEVQKLRAEKDELRARVEKLESLVGGSGPGR